MLQLHGFLHELILLHTFLGYRKYEKSVWFLLIIAQSGKYHHRNLICLSSKCMGISANRLLHVKLTHSIQRVAKHHFPFMKPCCVYLRAFWPHSFHVCSHNHMKQSSVKPSSLQNNKENKHQKRWRCSESPVLRLPVSFSMFPL